MCQSPFTLQPNSQVPRSLLTIFTLGGTRCPERLSVLEAHPIPVCLPVVPPTVAFNRRKVVHSLGCSNNPAIALSFTFTASSTPSLPQHLTSFPIPFFPVWIGHYTLFRPPIHL